MTGRIIGTDLSARFDLSVLIKNPCVEPGHVSVTSVKLETFSVSYDYTLGDPAGLSIELPNDFTVDQLILRDLCGSVATKSKVSLDLANQVREEFSASMSSPQVKSLHLLTEENQLSLVGSHVIEVVVYLREYEDFVIDAFELDLEIREPLQANGPVELEESDESDSGEYDGDSSDQSLQASPRKKVNMSSKEILSLIMMEVAEL